MIFFWMLAPTLAVYLLLHAPRAATALWRLARRSALLAPPARPTGWPIERIAADLRRLHRTLAEFPPGTPALRRQATRQAYDDLLAQACAAVDIPHRLDTLPEGVDREVERLRVEQALGDAGVRVS